VGTSVATLTLLIQYFHNRVCAPCIRQTNCSSADPWAKALVVDDADDGPAGGPTHFDCARARRPRKGSEPRAVIPKKRGELRAGRRVLELGIGIIVNLGKLAVVEPRVELVAATSGKRGRPEEVSR
jgi:hypothetical protein